MSDKETTTSYVELSSQAYALFVDAYASANRRALDYWKSIWEIASRPYASTSAETNIRENFERANQLVSLTIGELQTNGQKSAEFAEKLFAHGVKVQDSYVHALRGVVNTGISNMNYVKETATQQFDDFAKRLDEAQTLATAGVSKN